MTIEQGPEESEEIQEHGCLKEAFSRQREHQGQLNGSYSRGTASRPAWLEESECGKEW